MIDEKIASVVTESLKFYIEFKDGDVLIIDPSSYFNRLERYKKEDLVSLFGWEVKEKELLRKKNKNLWNELVKTLSDMHLMQDIKEIYCAEL